MARTPAESRGGARTGGPHLACVYVPALPLQLWLRGQPEARGRPAAVVEQDQPQGLVLWVNEEARRSRVLPGMRFAAALALCPGLRAGVVPPADLERGGAGLLDVLRGYSPEVEPADAEPGVFWVNAAGLQCLHPSLAAWAEAVRAGLFDAGYTAAVVVGYTRFGTYALARSAHGPAVLAGRQQERAAAQAVRLERLGMEPRLRDELGRLGIRTVGAFLQLPADGVLRRFGAEAHALHMQAAGDLAVPLQPLEAGEPLESRLDFDPPERDSTRLLFFVKRLLHPLLARLAARGQALVELRLGLEPEGGVRRVEVLRPASPTLAALLLLELVRLRLEALQLRAPLSGLVLGVQGAGVAPEQLRLFDEAPRRDREAAGRALARIRAEFGEGAVVHAVLREGHLPEARFQWQPLYGLPPAEAQREPEPPLVRRLHAPPLDLPPDAAELEFGPYVVSGGWWVREVHREYYFVETHGGEVLWVYYDRRRRHWFLHATLD